jgi:hypothetical protein
MVIPARTHSVLVSPIAAENNLSFIETSALDASNVEAAFQNILSGEQDLFALELRCEAILMNQSPASSSRHLSHCGKEEPGQHR